MSESGFPELFPDRGPLCPLGDLKRRPQQLNAITPNGVTSEKPPLTVDSGASDTLIPPQLLMGLELVHTHKVGQSYEVANGEMFHNLGEKTALLIISEKSKDELEIAFQVVEDRSSP